MKNQSLIRLIAPCPEEVKETVVSELKEIGIEQITQTYKAIDFITNKEQFYLCHLKLSTASSILKVIKEFPKIKANQVYKKARQIKWNKIFSNNKSFRVDATIGGRGRHLPSSNLISKEIRKAIQDDFNSAKENIPEVSLKKPHVIITAFYSEKSLIIACNTALTALHKRGYRTKGHPAPLKETIASSLIQFSGYNGTQALFDPMCGSGTIVIEACYKALNKACNIHRKKNNFGFEHLLDFDKDLWRDIQDKVRLEKKEQLDKPILAQDISSEYITMAKENSRRAKVEKFLSFEHKSFFDSTKPYNSGILISNLPYGDRLSQKEDFLEFYKKIGDHLKKHYSGWKVCLLVSENSPWKFIGLKPTNKINILNGDIKVKFLTFDIYEGSKKLKKQLAI